MKTEFSRCRYDAHSGSRCSLHRPSEVRAFFSTDYLVHTEREALRTLRAHFLHQLSGAHVALAIRPVRVGGSANP